MADDAMVSVSASQEISTRFGLTNDQAAFGLTGKKFGLSNLPPKICPLLKRYHDEFKECVAERELLD